MKTIFHESTYAGLVTRLDQLTATSERAWGRMTAPQVVCHLSDVFGVALGDIPHKVVGNFLFRTIIPFVALSTPLPWPKGAKTLPRFDQEVDGTPPGDFAADVAELKALMKRFADSKGVGLAPHPAFGQLSVGAWGRWGYRHVDHHLRQFSV